MRRIALVVCLAAGLIAGCGGEDEEVPDVGQRASELAIDACTVLTEDELEAGLGVAGIDEVASEVAGRSMVIAEREFRGEFLAGAEEPEGEERQELVRLAEANCKDASRELQELLN